VNITSLMRSLRKKFFGGTATRRKPFRRFQCLEVEPLEKRNLLAGVTPPVVLSVTPANLTVWDSGKQATPSPTITVTFNEAMFNLSATDPHSVTNPANYRLFDDTTNTAITINSVTYLLNADNTSTVTINYATGTGNALNDGTYTLFLEGANLFESSDVDPLAQPGQLVVATTNNTLLAANNTAISMINTDPNGAPLAAQTYPLGEDPSVVPPVTPLPAAVALVDLNGDGINDIAVANSVIGSVEIFLGKASGGFNFTPDATLYLATSPMAAGATITGIAAADLGNPNFVFGGPSPLPDLVTCDSTGVVNVFVNETTPGSSTLNFVDPFSTPVANLPNVGHAYAAGTDPVGIGVANFYGFPIDPFDIEIAVANGKVDGAKNFDVTIIQGDGFGDGGLTSGANTTINIGTATTGLEVPTGIALGDLNGDGFTDIAVSGSNGVLPLLNTSTAFGAFTFNPDGQGGAGSKTPLGVSSAGKPLSFTSVAIGTITPNSVTFAQQPSHAALGETVDDIATTTAGASSQLWAFPNNGSGTFSNATSTSFALNGSAQSVVLEDLTGGNGLASAVVASPSNNAFEVLIDQSTASSAAFAKPVGYQVDNNPVALAVGALNGGTNPSVVTVNVPLNNKPAKVILPTGSFSTVLGNGDGTFGDAIVTVNEVTKAAPNPNPESIAVGDLTGNGLTDLVVADSGANQVEVYLATAAGVYAKPVIYSTLDPKSTKTNLIGADPISVAVANLTGKTYANGDPILDIVTADGQADTSSNFYVSIVANVGDGTGTFQATATVKVGQNPTQLTAGVFDSNGGSKHSADLVVAHDGVVSKGVSFLLNTTTAGNPITFAPSVEVTVSNSNLNFTPIAVAAADFNGDGNLDFVLLNANNQAPGIYLVEGDGLGNFPSVLGPYPLSANLVPVALAVGDFTRDGFPDVAVVGQAVNGATAEVETLLTNTGIAANGQRVAFGFSSNVILSNVGIPGGAVLNSVAVTDVNGDPYPDLVVGTVFTPISPSNPATDDNLFTLAGAGDGTFGSPQPYEANGEPIVPPITPPIPPVVLSTVAVVSDPFLAVLTFFQTGPLVTTNLIQNGNFSSSDLSGETGNLDGWQTASQRDSEGEWTILQASATSSNVSPLSQTPVINPPVGQFMAMLDQYNLIPVVPAPGYGNPNPGSSNSNYNGSYNGSNFLYQTFTLPAVTIAATLTLDLYVNNTTGKWYTPASNPLDFNVPVNNEQVIIDFIAVPATPQGVTTASALPGGVVFQTTASTGTLINPSGAATLTFQLTPAFLSANAGKTIALRIAGINNNVNKYTDPNPPGPLIVGVDNVDLQVTFGDSTAPTLSGVHLRNPGPATGPNGLSSTSDPTIVGRVGDVGGIGAFAAPGFVKVSTNNTSLPGANVTFVTQFDALGNFSVTLTNLLHGTVTVTVTAENQAGQFVTQTFSFFYQGASTGGWESVGPGSISTAGINGVGYTSVSGRVTAVAVDPSDPSGNTFYVGSENGGVWKTTDGGANWTPLTDFITDQNGQPINVPVGGIAVAASNPQVVYAATGDGNVLADSVGGVGVLVSTNGGKTWAVDGNSGALLAGDRITGIAVDPNNANNVYVAVAGGPSGPGVFRTLNGLDQAPKVPTWTNILTIANMSYPGIPGNPAHGVTAGTTLASVTSLYLDSFNPNQITVGLGNIGLATASSTGGVWITPNASNPSGATWTAMIGGDNIAIPNNTLPQGTGLGRVTVGEGSGIGNGEKVFYVLIGNPTSATPVTGGSEVFGTESGLFKTSDGGLNWTKVQLMQQTGFTLPDKNGIVAPIYTPINLLGNDAGNAGSLVVDPTDPSVVYVGGSVGYNSPAQSYLDHGFIQVDTGDMLDATPQGILNAKQVEHDALLFDKLTVKEQNTGDDFQKALTAYDFGGYYDPTANIYQYGKNGIEGISWYDFSNGHYQGGGGEEVSWYDPSLGQWVYSGSWSVLGVSPPPLPTPLPPVVPSLVALALAPSSLPPEVMQMTLDPQGRLLVGTEEGLWRVGVHGIGYDFTSDGDGIMSAFYDAVVTVLPSATISVSTINSNLQISDLTSVAVDPLNPGTYYAAGYGTGIERTSPSNLAQWQTMGLNGPNGQVDAGTVLTALPDPALPPGAPSTVYVNYSYNITGTGFTPEQSTQGGAPGSFITGNTGAISINDNAGFFPVLALDPTKIVNPNQKNQFEDELFFGTSKAYGTQTSGNLWLNIGKASPLSSNASFTTPSYVTAAAIAPSDENLIYAGTNNGEVFVTQNYGVDGWPEEDSGLPVGQPGALITDFSVDPTNPMTAFVTIGGTGAYAHVYTTTNGGGVWTPIQGSGSGALPYVPALSIVTDPRAAPLAGAPKGYLYIGTQVGAFESLDGGSTWKPLGGGLPNVPVVSLSFNLALEELVAGTQGRGVFVLSTNRDGANVVSVSPSAPVREGISSVQVTFNEAIGAFPLSQVISITGPNGIVIAPTSVKDVTPVLQGLASAHNVFQITFPALTADGGYTFVIGPGITDQTGNAMDQNQNGVNGQPGVAPVGDAYSFQVVVNSTDDGQFLSGLYNALDGVSANSAGFLSFLNQIDPARFASLTNVATQALISTTGRTQLINDLYDSTSTPLSPIGIGNLIGQPATQAQINQGLALLSQGNQLEAVIDSIVSSDQYLNLATTGGTDLGFVTQAFVSLLGGVPSTVDPTTYVNNLAAAEQNARYQTMLAVVNSNPGLANFVNTAYSLFLNGATPSPTQLNNWVTMLLKGTTTEQKLIATLVGTAAYARNPNLYLGQYITFEYSAIVPLHNNGNGPTATDLSTWETAFAKGAPLQTLVASLLSSSEYYQYRTGLDGVATLNAQDQDWLPVAYSLATGQSPFPQVSASLLQGLDNAEISARSSFLSQTITSGSVYHNYITTNVFNQLLGHGPSQAQLNGWNSILSQPSKGKGTPSQDEYMLATILSSQEYFYDQTDINGLHTNTSWVNGVYSALGLPIDPNAVNNVLNGYLSQRQAVIRSFLNSPAYLSNIITQDFEKYLRRAPTAADISLWENNFAHGTTREQEIAILMGSVEYFNTVVPEVLNLNKAPSNAQFAQVMFADLFPWMTLSPSMLTSWTNLLNSGKASHQSLAMQQTTGSVFLFSIVDKTHGVVNAIYNLYLGHNATPAGGNPLTYTGNYGGDNSLITTLLSSPEYFVKSHPFP